MAKILSISYDQPLLITRHLLLESKGYEVTSAEGFAEAQERAAGDFDLIIVGHSIPKSDKVAIIAKLRELGCNAPVLSILRAGESPVPGVAAAVDPDPRHVLDTVAAMLLDRKAKGA